MIQVQGFNCVVCRKPIPERIGRQITCGPTCAKVRQTEQLAELKRRRKADAATRKATSCGICGGPLAQTGKGRPAKYCSDQCKAEALVRSSQAQQQRRKVNQSPATEKEIS